MINLMMFNVRALMATSFRFGKYEVTGMQMMQALALLALAFILFAMPGMAMAADDAAPWEGGVCRAMKAVTGRWVGWVAIIAVVLAAVMYGVGESNQTFQTAMRIVAGFSVALGAAAAVAFFWPGVIVPSSCASLGSF